MLNKEALDHIAASANIPGLLAQIKKETVTAIAVLPDSMHVENLEIYQEFASRLKGRFNTSSLKSFTEYHKSLNTEAARCFINPKRYEAETIFDFGNEEKPGHKVNSAVFKLELSAAYKAIKNITTLSTQKAIAELYEDWADFLSFEDQSGNPMTAAAAAQSIRSVTIESARQIKSDIGDLSNTMSAMEKIEAKQGVAIATNIKAKVKPAKELKERQINIKLSIRTGEEKPSFMPRIIAFDQLKEDIAEELATLIENELIETDTQVFIGDF